MSRALSLLLSVMSMNDKGREIKKTVAILQARMGSTRLPGKVLMPLADKTVLDWAVERAQRAKSLDELVLATSANQQDDPLEEFSARRGLACFRGSEDDVLDRYYQAAQSFKAKVVVRLTGDNPLVDGEFVDWVIDAYHDIGADYVAAVPGEEWHLPVGLAAEVFSFTALAEAWQQDKNPLWREHVTPFIRCHTKHFKVCYLTAPVEYLPARITVDEPADLELMQLVFDYFKPRDFSWREAIELVRQHPEWIALNKSIEQKKVKPGEL